MPARASRLDRTPPYLFGEIARLKAKALAEGRDLIDFGIGDPDQPTPRDIIDHLYEAAQDPATHRYDETPYGEPFFLQAVAEWYRRRYGVSVEPEGEILLLIGSKEGLAHLAWAYIEPGDIALVPDPAYTVYAINTRMAGGETYIMPLKRENSFLPDLSAIPSDVARRAKLLFLNYPNNPTGAVATQEFYQQAVRFAREYDILLVNDAAYSEVVYEGYRHPSLLQVEGAKEIAIEFNSLSKMFNMTGWRIGFAAGNRDAIANLNKMKSYVDSKQFAAISRAGAYALLYADNTRTLNLYQKRRDILVEGLQSIGWDVQKPKATFYVWVPTPGGMSSIEFAKQLLERAGILAIPGVGYGEHGEGYVRFSITVSGDHHGERVEEAVGRIREHFG
ncbi:MAG: LL-diaminopimelate aminotransferase [Armatimonadota bacterium]|nr:LL-diaminopimelate aminotransferase [bacterium]MDW8320939.1 LL-diaminopimelate aminotransferase [Armatimonadota bacterium]